MAYESQIMNINNGIFLGDSLSLSSFCIALIHLAIELKKTLPRY